MSISWYRSLTYHSIHFTLARIPGGDAQAQGAVKEDCHKDKPQYAPPNVAASSSTTTILGPSDMTGADGVITPTPAGDGSAPLLAPTGAAAVTTAPPSFSTLPAIPSESISNVAVPPITPETNTTAGRFTLTIIAVVSNPYADGYTDGDLAQSLNNSALFTTNTETGATLNTSSSQPLPMLSTFALDADVFQTWDGRVAYVDPAHAQRSADSSIVSSVPIFFGKQEDLTQDEQGGILSCSLPANQPSFWQGDPTVARDLTCTAKPLGTEIRELFICEKGADGNSSPGVSPAYEGNILIGASNPSGCVPVRLRAVGALGSAEQPQGNGQGTTSVSSGARRHRRGLGVHKVW